MSGEPDTEFWIRRGKILGMMANPGIYVCGDSAHPEATVVIASVDGRLHQMKLDGELAPDGFLPTFVIKSGPHK